MRHDAVSTKLYNMALAFAPLTESAKSQARPSNEAEARRLVEVARTTGSPLIVGVHYRYHPLAERIAEVVKSGALGKLLLLDIVFNVPAAMMSDDDIRFNYGLAGGACMDLGYYCLDMGQLVTGEEARIDRARAQMLAHETDYAMEVDISYPGGCKGALHFSLKHPHPDLEIVLRLEGTEGILEVTNPIVPHWESYPGKLVLGRGDQAKVERFSSTSTYELQLRHAVKVVSEGLRVRTPPETGLEIMRGIDAIYRAAGLSIRGN